MFLMYMAFNSIFLSLLQPYRFVRNIIKHDHLPLSQLFSDRRMLQSLLSSPSAKYVFTQRKKNNGVSTSNLITNGKYVNSGQKSYCICKAKPKSALLVWLIVPIQTCPSHALSCTLSCTPQLAPGSQETVKTTYAICLIHLVFCTRILASVHLKNQFHLKLSDAFIAKKSGAT